MNKPVQISAPEPTGFPVCASTVPTYAPLTHPTGKDEWISSMRAYLARSGLLRGGAGEALMMDGLIPSASSKKPARQLSSLNVLKPLSGRIAGSAPPSIEPVTVSASRLSPMLPAWALRTLGDDIGLLATPTTKANQCAASMQKHPSCRRLTLALGGKIHPPHWEWMMGWPIGFTAFGRRETAKSPSKPPPHTSCLEGR